MRIDDWLSRMPEGTGEQLARSALWHAACADGAGWTHAAASPAGVRKAAAALPAEAAALLKLVLLRYGPRPFEAEPLAEYAERSGWTAAAVKRTLSQLCGAGIVFALSKSWGDRFYCLPSDGYAWWLNALLPAQTAPVGEGVTIRPQQPYTEPLSLQLLQAASELAKAGLAVTAQGVLPKRTAAAAAARLKFGPEQLRPLAMRSIGRDNAPIGPADAALDALAQLGLIASEDGRLVWRGEPFAAWLAADAAARERRLLDLISERYAAYDERYMHAAALLRGMRGGVWYDAAPIEQWLEQHGAPAAARDWRGWLQTLAGFGWLQTAITAAGAEAIRWTIDPQAALSAGDGADRRLAGTVRVAPAGGLTVPPDVAYPLRWELELMAEPVSPGPMAEYRFTAKSVARYVELGRTEADVADTLRAASGGALPDGVGTLAAQYARTSGRVSFAEALLLRFADEASAELAAADPQVRPLLGERLGSCCFAVERQHVPELRKRLARAGTPARSGIAGGTEPPLQPAPRGATGADTGRSDEQPTHMTQPAVKPSSPHADVPAGLLESPFPWRLYNVDTAVVEYCADQHGRPGAAVEAAVERLPSAWLRTARDYHPSTRREIVKHAIELGAAVRLVRDGGVIDVLPNRIDETGSDWRMHGRLKTPSGTIEAAEPQAVTLSPHMWSAMQLLLPDSPPSRK